MNVDELIKLYEFKAFMPAMHAFLKQNESKPRQIGLTFPDVHAFKKVEIYKSLLYRYPVYFGKPLYHLFSDLMTKSMGKPVQAA